MRISESELILNPDGSIYHLNLKPNDIAHTIIMVGDPERVEAVSKHFDTIRLLVNKREFVTHTGTLRGVDLTVISTGIGTDNIDIVINELDALVNIDFESRTIKDNLTSLDIIRIGTSGCMQADIPLDSILISEIAIGFDNLIHFYSYDNILETQFTAALMDHIGWPDVLAQPYTIRANPDLFKKFRNIGFNTGCTVTIPGFYGPQGRVLRLKLAQKSFMDRMTSFKFEDKRLTNLEMETAGVYVMAALLGHRAVSLNALLANRKEQTFSENPALTVNRLITSTLDCLCP